MGHNFTAGGGGTSPLGPPSATACCKFLMYIIVVTCIVYNSRDSYWRYFPLGQIHVWLYLSLQLTFLQSATPRATWFASLVSRKKNFANNFVKYWNTLNVSEKDKTTLTGMLLSINNWVYFTCSLTLLHVETAEKQHVVLSVSITQLQSAASLFPTRAKTHACMI